MKTKRIGKVMVCLAGILIATIFCVGDVLAWNWGVHAYIDDHLGKRDPLRNMNEIYGGVGPDVFNYLFDDPQLREYLFQKTHEDFMGLWRKACTPLGKAEAYGFVSHNELWGADHTAHIQAQTPGIPGGYVVAKAQPIADYLLAFLPSIKVPVTPEIALVLGHNIVEAAVDILVVQNLDHMIGKKLSSSAVLRSPEFSLLLVRAYARDYAEAKGVSYSKAAEDIIAFEREFRKNVFAYGNALMQENALELISEQMAALAVSFLGLPQELIPQLAELAEQLILMAMSACASTYAGEIEATIGFVKGNLVFHHVSY